MWRGCRCHSGMGGRRPCAWNSCEHAAHSGRGRCRRADSVIAAGGIADGRGLSAAIHRLLGRKRSNEIRLFTAQCWAVHRIKRNSWHGCADMGSGPIRMWSHTIMAMAGEQPACSGCFATSGIHRAPRLMAASTAGRTRSCQPQLMATIRSRFLRIPSSKLRKICSSIRVSSRSPCARKTPFCSISGSDEERHDTIDGQYPLGLIQDSIWTPWTDYIADDHGRFIDSTKAPANRCWSYSRPPRHSVRAVRH